MNVRYILISLFITIILFFLYHAYFREVNRFAYIDSARLMNGYTGMISAKNKIAAREKSFLESVDTMSFEFKNDLKKYEKERAKMTDEKKEFTEKLLKRKQEQFILYKDNMKKKLTHDEEKITVEVLKKINVVVSEYGKKNNYIIIFGTTSGNIVYANDAINITEEVLNILNSN